MASTIGNLVNRLSGGSSNTNPALSLGGVISSQAVSSQVIDTPSLVTGVTVVSAHNNPAGSGTLSYTVTGSVIGWRPPSSANTYTVTITGDGQYFVGNSSEGFLVLDVATGSLPGGSRSEGLGVNKNMSNLWDTVHPAESLAGRVEYRCTYLKNTGDTTMFNINVWIKEQTAAQDDIAIALDPAGKGDGSATGIAITIANEIDSTDQLAGVSFSAPISIGTALQVGDLLPGQCIGLWERRNVPANTTQQNLSNYATIAVTADI
ncbi:MAG: hypothetical protein LPH21_12945 [Shewanella sp.]|nr:hypothetical protein [Shewanella sp.]